MDKKILIISGSLFIIIISTSARELTGNSLSGRIEVIPWWLGLDFLWALVTQAYPVVLYIPLIWIAKQMKAQSSWRSIIKLTLWHLLTGLIVYVELLIIHSLEFPIGILERMVYQPIGYLESLISYSIVFGVRGDVVYQPLVYLWYGPFALVLINYIRPFSIFNPTIFIVTPIITIIIFYGKTLLNLYKQPEKVEFSREKEKAINREEKIENCPICGYKIPLFQKKTNVLTVVF